MKRRYAQNEHIVFFDGYSREKVYAINVTFCYTILNWNRHRMNAVFSNVMLIAGQIRRNK